MTKAKKNIHYVSPEISQFYLKHRSKWDDFYPSEKWILNRLAKPKGMYSRVLLEPGSIPEAPNPELGRILDVGCAAGGLFLALSEKFHGLDYWGVDINSQAIEVAQQRANKMNLENCHFKSGDILEVEMASSGTFDVVFSLSCADWNLSTNEIMKKCWQFVKPGGNFVISLRLSSNPSIKVFNIFFLEKPFPIISKAVRKRPMWY